MAVVSAMARVLLDCFMFTMSVVRATVESIQAWHEWVMRALRTPAPRELVQRCTADLGLLDALPPELLPDLLAAGQLTAADLARCAATCSTLAGAVSDPANDALLWQPACRERWATKAYDPLLVYPEKLAHLSHRRRTMHHAHKT